MSWQDIVFGFGGLFFAASLWPTIRSRTAEVPLATSVPTALILALYVVAEYSLGLYLAAAGGVLSAGAWFLVAGLRRPRSEGLASASVVLHVDDPEERSTTSG